MYNHNKAQQNKNRVHISWDILYEECHFRNPNWKFTSILSVSRNSDALLYIILSKTFDKTFNNDNGL